ncbi:FMN-binding protein [Lacisediminihabitans profunda]|uniref:FMN-binding protein n=1 Tax=Lacisediminihabitans profunda TaxID=2594790 RepID=A0A5C8UW20_9MICO|nr:FMN-binding protein [Lacisediminihabitans profunda]
MGAVGSLAVLAVAWQVGTLLDAGQSPGGTASPAATTTATPGASASPATDGSFVGAVENTRYGTVQVKVVVAGGKITDVVALHLTDQGGRSVQLSNYAAPILRSAVIKSQSAKVSNVSGATYTSKAYLLSVQSALDKAGL